MLGALKDYKQLPASLLYLIVAQYGVAIAHTSFITYLPLFAKLVGYSDSEYALFTSYRWIGPLLFSFLLAIYIKGRRILPLIKIAYLTVPISAFLVLVGYQSNNETLIITCNIINGLAYGMTQVMVIPYIYRNTPKEKRIMATTLFIMAFPISNVFANAFVSTFNFINPHLFNELNLLVSMTCISLLLALLIFKTDKQEQVPVKPSNKNQLLDYDWPAIRIALIPHMFFLLGVGLIIPFIALFFANTFNMSTSTYALLAFLSSSLVATFSIFAPKIKSTIGFKKAIPGTQIIAIIALIIMASTEHYSHLPIAVVIASGFFIIRQPFMFLAIPMTTDLTMNYLGEKNREMGTGLQTLIASAMGYCSALLFAFLRNNNISYSNIFYLTSILYVFALIGYKVLYHRYSKQQKY